MSTCAVAYAEAYQHAYGSVSARMRKSISTHAEAYAVVSAVVYEAQVGTVN
jgi:hypothetical protein